jgi:hypothetical protein
MVKEQDDDERRQKRKDEVDDHRGVMMEYTYLEREYP